MYTHYTGFVVYSGSGCCTEIERCKIDASWVQRKVVSSFKINWRVSQMLFFLLLHLTFQRQRPCHSVFVSLLTQFNELERMTTEIQHKEWFRYHFCLDGCCTFCISFWLSCMKSSVDCQTACNRRVRYMRFCLELPLLHHSDCKMECISPSLTKSNLNHMISFPFFRLSYSVCGRDFIYFRSVDEYSFCNLLLSIMQTSWFPSHDYCSRHKH